MIVAPVRFRLIVDYSQSRGDAEDYEARRTLAEKLNLTTVPSIASIPRFGGYVIDEIMTDLKGVYSKDRTCYTILFAFVVW